MTNNSFAAAGSGRSRENHRAGASDRSPASDVQQARLVGSLILPRNTPCLTRPFTLPLRPCWFSSFVVASACWAIGSLLTRKSSDGRFQCWPCRWFNLLDMLAVACFIVVITAVSFFLVHYPPARFHPESAPPCGLLFGCRPVATMKASRGPMSTCFTPSHPAATRFGRALSQRSLRLVRRAVRRPSPPRLRRRRLGQCHRGNRIRGQN